MARDLLLEELNGLQEATRSIRVLSGRYGRLDLLQNHSR
jgi:hypothetical protein